ncbi:MAG TPA: hypothetical protein VJ647_01420 [Chitinophagaceae bacterium]|nr:hypothetical protein [Chitinophagaceae bacterium]
MKQKHYDYLGSSIWYRETITDPYQVIAEAFDFSEISYYRKVIKGILLSTQTDKIYDEVSPSNLLFQFRMMESVINACYLINKENKKSPLTIGAGDYTNRNLYYGRHDRKDGWDYFPRCLSRKEFMDPYLVFKRFFKFRELQQWKMDLEEVLNRALSRSDERLEISVDILSMYFYLTRLFEAAHLIDVREITHVGGHIKNRV